MISDFSSEFIDETRIFLKPSKMEELAEAAIYWDYDWISNI